MRLVPLLIIVAIVLISVALSTSEEGYRNGKVTSWVLHNGDREAQLEKLLADQTALRRRLRSDLEMIREERDELWVELTNLRNSTAWLEEDDGRRP